MDKQHWLPSTVARAAAAGSGGGWRVVTAVHVTGAAYPANTQGKVRRRPAAGATPSNEPSHHGGRWRRECRDSDGCVSKADRTVCPWAPFPHCAFPIASMMPSPIAALTLRQPRPSFPPFRPPMPETRPPVPSELPSNPPLGFKGEIDWLSTRIAHP